MSKKGLVIIDHLSAGARYGLLADIRTSCQRYRGYCSRTALRHTLPRTRCRNLRREYVIHWAAALNIPVKYYAVWCAIQQTVHRRRRLSRAAPACDQQWVEKIFSQRFTQRVINETMKTGVHWHDLVWLKLSNIAAILNVIQYTRFDLTESR